MLLVDRDVPERRRRRESRRRRPGQRRRQRRQIDEPRARNGLVGAAERRRKAGRHAERAALVEDCRQRESDAIVEHRVAAANRPSCPRRSASRGIRPWRAASRRPRDADRNCSCPSRRTPSGRSPGPPDRAAAAAARCQGCRPSACSRRAGRTIRRATSSAPPADRSPPRAANRGCNARRRSVSGSDGSASCPARRTRTRRLRTFARTGSPTGSAVPSRS